MLFHIQLMYFIYMWRKQTHWHQYALRNDVAKNGEYSTNKQYRHKQRCERASATFDQQLLIYKTGP